MTDPEKQIVAKLEIIEELAQDNSVKQVAKTMIEYIKVVSKGDVGFHK